MRSQAIEFARLHFRVKTEAQQSIEIAGFLMLCWLRGHDLNVRQGSGSRRMKTKNQRWRNN